MTPSRPVGKRGGKEIWIVEYRTGDASEVTLAHLSSSKRRAVNWLRRNKDFDRKDEHWWWCVFPMVLDSKTFYGDGPPDGEGLFFFSKHGRALKNQPIRTEER